MLNYDWRQDRYVRGPVKSLEEQIYDEIGLGLSELDRRYDNPKPGKHPDYDAIDRIDGYISGLEKLLAWEG